MISRDDRIAREQAVNRLQTHLCSIRNLAGWSTTDLAERLGVTKQTIWNLENKNTKMTMIQYIAIRSVIDAEIAAHPEKETLKNAVHLFLDAEVPDEEQERVDDMSDFFSHASSASEQTFEKLFNVMWNDAITTGAAVMKATAEVVDEVVEEIPKWMDNFMKAFNIGDDDSGDSADTGAKDAGDVDADVPDAKTEPVDDGIGDGNDEENKEE